jgi:sugar/nucleoside kinase (ribokinase family)
MPCAFWDWRLEYGHERAFLCFLRIGPLRVQSMPVPALSIQPVDAVGAGDSFNFWLPM